LSKNRRVEDGIVEGEQMEANGSDYVDGCVF
jgi:hypothetical protein